MVSEKYKIVGKREMRSTNVSKTTERAAEISNENGSSQLLNSCSSKLIEYDDFCINTPMHVESPIEQIIQSSNPPSLRPKSTLNGSRESVVRGKKICNSVGSDKQVILIVRGNNNKRTNRGVRHTNSQNNPGGYLNQKEERENITTDYTIRKHFKSVCERGEMFKERDVNINSNVVSNYNPSLDNNSNKRLGSNLRKGEENIVNEKIYRSHETGYLGGYLQGPYLNCNSVRRKLNCNIPFITPKGKVISGAGEHSIILHQESEPQPQKEHLKSKQRSKSVATSYRGGAGGFNLLKLQANNVGKGCPSACMRYKSRTNEEEYLEEEGIVSRFRPITCMGGGAYISTGNAPPQGRKGSFSCLRMRVKQVKLGPFIPNPVVQNYNPRENILEGGAPSNKDNNTNNTNNWNGNKNCVFEESMGSGKEGSSADGVPFRVHVSSKKDIATKHPRAPYFNNFSPKQMVQAKGINMNNAIYEVYIYYIYIYRNGIKT